MGRISAAKQTAILMMNGMRSAAERLLAPCLLRHKSRMKMRLYSIAADMAEGWVDRIGDLWEAEMYRVEDMEGELEIHWKIHALKG